MIFVDHSDLRSLTEAQNRLLQTFPKARQELMELVGQKMLSTVQENIGGAGKVQGWQSLHMGSKGGYAAVRAKAKTFEQKKRRNGTTGKAYAVGALTNAIENGYKVRGPSGKAKRYRPRIHKSRVAGKGFYQKAGGQVDALAQRAAGDLVDRLMKEMEG